MPHIELDKNLPGITASVTPADPSFYERLAQILKNNGYMPSPGRYDSLKK